MTWRVMGIGSRVSTEQCGRCLVVETVPFTDDEGWIDVAISHELRTTLRAGDLRTRLTIGIDTEGREALFVDAVRMKGREFASLHAFAMSQGGGWISYIPHEVKRAFDDHVATYEPSRQSGFRPAERPRRDAVIARDHLAANRGSRR